MNYFFTTFLVLVVVLVLLPNETYAFGAGEIPDFAYLNGVSYRRFGTSSAYTDRYVYSSGKAFRHGDIEDILSELAKTAGHAAASGGLMELAQSVFSAATGGSKFSSSDVQRVYFVCHDCAFFVSLWHRMI